MYGTSHIEQVAIWRYEVLGVVFSEIDMVSLLQVKVRPTQSRGDKRTIVSLAYQDTILAGRGLMLCMAKTSP